MGFRNLSAWIRASVDSSAPNHVSKHVIGIEHRSVSWSNPLRIIIHPVRFNSLTHTKQAQHKQHVSKIIVGK